MLSEMVRQFIVKEAILPAPIVAAISGGPDSTALLLALEPLRREGFRVEAAHVNHHLRGAESDGDETFAAGVAARLGIPFHRADAPLDPGLVRHRGIEAAAREVRYATLLQLRDRIGAGWIATGHHRSDQAETVLIRLLTGAGLASLRGIRRVRADGVIRPMLDATRSAIDACLATAQLSPRRDRTNDDLRFLRNRVRRMLAGHDDAVDALARIADAADDAWPLFERAVVAAERTRVRALEGSAEFLSWPDDLWLREQLLRRQIHRLDPEARDVSAASLGRLVLDSRPSRVSVTRELELVATAEGGSVLRRRPSPVDPYEWSITPGTARTIPGSKERLRLERASHAPSSSELRGPRQFLEVPHEGGSFVIRNRRAGDRFQPHGLTSPKKLKDFFIDRKIAAADRDRIPLLLWNGEIAWIAGVEVSERFKVTGQGGVLYQVWMEGEGADV